MIDTTWTWRQLAPASPPSARAAIELIWVGDQGLMFGGVDGSTDYDDLFALIADEFVELSPTTRPSARHYYKAAWDGTGYLLVGGLTAASVTNRETWRYTSDFTQLTPVTSLPPYNSASPTFFSVQNDSQLMWDGTRFLILHPMFTTPGPGTRLYEFASNTWTRVACTPEHEDVGYPSEDDVFLIASCWAGDRIVAGSGEVSTGGGGHFPGTNDDTTRELTGTTWAQTVASNGFGPGVHGNKFTWTGDEVVSFGGYDGTDYYNDVNVYTPGGSSWTTIVPGGTPPPARFIHGQMWDGHRLIVSHGEGASGALGDTWALEPPTVYSIAHPFGLRP